MPEKLDIGEVRGDRTVRFGELIPGGKAGENTWNSRLAEGLRSHGYPSAEFEILFPTLKGLRKPDVVFQSPRGTVVISGKLGSSNEVEAIVSAQEYQATLSKVSPISEVFAITYPRGRGDEILLRLLGTAEHDSIPWKVETLDIAIGKITDVVKADWAKARVDQESVINSAIRVLQRGVEEFSAAIVDLPLESVAAIFGGHDFFDSVLGYGPTRTDRQKGQILRSAAAYLYLNQVLFYEVLARETGTYPPIAEEDYDKPSALKPKYFDRVLLRDYRPIFSFDVASQFRGPRVANGARKIIVAIKALFPGEVNHDLLGKVFHNIIDPDFRKLVAAYFTNSSAGDLLARLTVRSSGDTVFDPACGSGTLLVSAYKRKLALLGRPLSGADHKRFVEKDLTGIDIMAFSAHLAAVNLALQAPLHDTDIVRIAVEDSTDHLPGEEIRSARDVLKQAFKGRRLDDFDEAGHHSVKSSERVRSGAVTIGPSEGQGFVLGRPDVIIMNPPFTSCDNLPAAYKKDLEGRFSSPREYADCITGKLSFQAYFLLLADKFLPEGGRLACVLPFTTFTAKAFRQVIQGFYLKRFTIRAIVVGMGRSAFSDATQLAELLLIAEKRAPSPESRFILVGTKSSPTDWTPEDVESIADQIETSERDGKSHDTALASTRVHGQAEMASDEVGLSRMVSEFEPGSETTGRALDQLYSESERVTTFADFEVKNKSDFFAWELRVKGGRYYGFTATSIVRRLGTGQKFKDALILKNASASSYRVLNRITAAEHSIPAKFVRPCVRRLSEIDHINISGETDFVVAVYYPALAEIIQSLLPDEEAREVEQRLKRDWEKKVIHGLSQVCLARRIDLASPGTHILAVYSKEPAFLAANSWGIRNIDDEVAKLLTLWLNSSLFLHELLSRWSRTRGSWGQLDENQLLQIHTIDFSKLTVGQRRLLLGLFKEMGKAPLPSIRQQLEGHHPIRAKVDGAFLRIVGVPEGKELGRLVVDLQDRCSHLLKQMRRTMKED